MGFFPTAPAQRPPRGDPVTEQKGQRGPIFRTRSGLRFYSPELGRWIRRDPAGQHGGPNPHVFVFNSPIADTDYLGLKISGDDEIIVYDKSYARKRENTTKYVADATKLCCEWSVNGSAKEYRSVFSGLLQPKHAIRVYPTKESAQINDTTITAATAGAKMQ